MAALKRPPTNKYLLLGSAADDTSTSTTKDAAGKYTITLTGSPGRVSDLWGDAASNSLSLNGSTQNGTVSTVLDVWPQQCTFLVACKPSSDPSNQRVFTKFHKTLGAPEGVTLYVDGSQKFVVSCSSDAGYAILTSTVTAAVGSTFLIAIRYGSCGMEFYINGVRVADATGRAWHLPGDGTPDPLIIGGYKYDGSAVSNRFPGAVEVWAYACEMTATECLAYTAGNIPSYDSEYTLWQEVTGNGQPTFKPTQAWEENAIFEPSLLPQATGLLFTDRPALGMFYTGGYSVSYTGYAEYDPSTGLIRKAAGPIFGNGTGGQSGAVHCPNVFTSGGTSYMHYSIGGSGTGTSLGLATVSGTTITKVGEAIATDAVSGYDGYANSSDPLLIGSTYYMLVEAHTTPGAIWNLLLFSAPAVTGPWTYVSNATGLQVSTGSYSGPCWKLIGSTVYLWYHGSRSSVLPTYTFKATIAAASIETGSAWVQSPDSPNSQFVYGSTWDVDQKADPSLAELLGCSYKAEDMGNDAGQAFAIMLQKYPGPLSDVATNVTPNPYAASTLASAANVKSGVVNGPVVGTLTAASLGGLRNRGRMG